MTTPEAVPCPGCSGPLEPEQEVCPHCRRPRDQREIELGRQALADEERRLRRRPRLIAGGVAACAVLAGLFHARHDLPGVSALSGRACDPAVLMGAPTTPPPAAAPDNAPAMPGQTGNPAPVTPKEVPDLAVGAMEPTQWAVYGRVYDLNTLRPVGGVAIEFAHSMDAAVYLNQSTVSDADGRYLLTLERSNFPGGFEAVCKNARYLKTVFHEADVLYAALPAAERARLIDSARNDDRHSTPIDEIPGEDSRRLDLFLVPREGPSPVAPEELPRPVAAEASRPAPMEKTRISTSAAAADIPDLVVASMAPEMWAVYGRIYDLRTLQPAVGVSIAFVHNAGGHKGGGISDEKGRYMATLRRSSAQGGYEASSNDTRYQALILHETDIPYARLTAEERESIIDSANSGELRSTPLADIPGADSRRLDLFLVPRR